MEPKKKTIKAREFVNDVRSGMDDDALMEKYTLTREQFHKLLGMAADSRLITSDELCNRISHTRTAVTRAFAEMQEAVRELAGVTAVIDKGTDL